MQGNYRETLENVQQGMGTLGEQLPNVMKAFGQLHQAGVTDGNLSAKMKELISVAIAVTVRCDGCIAFHVHDALAAGATPEEIAEAVGVAILMGGGPSVVYGTQALQAIEEFQNS